MSAAVADDVEIPADLLERGMMLPRSARAKFANLLLEANELPPDDPELVRKEVNELIADRLEGYLSGRYKTVDARESLKRVRERLERDFPQ